MYHSLFSSHSCQSKYSQPSFDLLPMFDTSLSEISINLMLNIKMFGQKKGNWIWINICLHWFTEIKTNRANAPDKTWGVLYSKKSMPDIGKQIFSTISQIVLNGDSDAGLWKDNCSFCFYKRVLFSSSISTTATESYTVHLHEFLMEGWLIMRVPKLGL